MTIRTRILEQASAAVVARPVTVLVAGALLTAASVWVARDLPLHASRMDYLSPRDPTSVQYQDFVDNFAPLNSIYVVLEGEAVERRRFADEAAGALRPMAHVRTVIHRLDVKRYRALGLYLKSEAELDATCRDLVDALPVLRETAGTPTLAHFLESAAAEMGDEDRPAPPVADARRSVNALGATVRALDASLSGSPENTAVLPGFSVRQDGFKRLHVDDDGYFASDDGGAGMLILWPSISMNRDASIRPFLADLQARLAPVRARHPRIRVSMAGGPVRDLEEHETVNRDLAVTSAVSGVAVLLLLRLGYSAWAPALLLMVVVTQCIAFTLLAVRLLVGHLTLLSSVFIAILFGLGDDFGSYLILRADELRADGAPDAIRRATAEVGASVLTGATTMAAAFFSLCLHDLPAFKQLGTIVGTGVTITYLSMVTLLPAYLCVLARSGGGALARADARGFWLSRALVATSRRPRLVLGSAAVITALALVALPSNRFEYDLARLLPEGGAASRAQEMVKARFGMSPDFNVVVTRTVDEARAVCDALRSAPTVSRLDSVSLLVPDGVSRKAPIVAQIATIARRIPAVSGTVAPSHAPELDHALSAMEAALARPRALARMTQDSGLDGDVTRLATNLEAVRRRLSARQAAAPGDVAAALRTLDACVGRELTALTTLLRDATSAEPYTLSTLPDEWKLRFVGNDGRIATYVLPAVDISYEDAARAFYEDTVRVAPAATGIPLIVYRSMTMVQQGWRRASVYVLAAVFVVVFLDFSKRRLALLALLPLALGLLWMHGALTCAGVTWNALSMLALPIVLGCGVDYGVQLLHRYLAEGDLDRALASSGRAIAYAAMTTAVGFGSLAFARHRGLASFGRAAFHGTAGCLVVALAVVPAILRLYADAGDEKP